MTPTCPFCSTPPERVIESNEHAFVIRDGFPVSPGHTLIVSRRHVESFFALDDQERQGLLGLVATAKAGLDTEYGPAGYNVGINDRAAAGQTIPHVHVHLIPRYEGDAADPRGGIRWVLPAKARYWA